MQTTFDERRISDPQGTIDDLIVQTTRQAVAVHELTIRVKSLEDEAAGALERESSTLVTEALIESAKTAAGAWTRRQLAAIGVSWPPAAGWKKRCTGKRLNPQEVEEFFSDSARSQPMLERKSSCVSNPSAWAGNPDAANFDDGTCPFDT